MMMIMLFVKRSLIVVEILEIKVPLLSAHLPVHNPLSISDQLTMKPLPEVEQKVAELI